MEDDNRMESISFKDGLKRANNLIRSIYFLLWIPFCFHVFIVILDAVTVHRATVIPEEIRTYYTKKDFYEQKQAIYIEYSFALASSLLFSLAATIVIWKKIIRCVWNFSLKIVKKFSCCCKNEELWTSWIAIFIILSVQSVPTLVQAIFYSGTEFYVVILTAIFSLMSMFVLSSILYYGTQKLGTKFYIYLVVACSISMFVFAVLGVKIILYALKMETVLIDEDLQNGIRNLSEKTSVPVDKITIANGEMINAFTTGYFNWKEIVIFDTFLKCVRCSRDKCGHTLTSCTNETTTAAVTYRRYFTTDEILGVLAHEVGHWIENDATTTLIVLIVLVTLIWLSVFPLFRTKYLYKAFGFHQKRPVIIGLYLVTTFVILPVNYGLIGYLINVIGRSFEYRADIYARNIGYGQQLKSALIKIHLASEVFPIRSKLYSLLKLNHPTLIERIAKIDDLS